MSLLLAVILAASGPVMPEVSTTALDGVDSDTICFAAFASEANQKEKAGKPSELIESAAGYFLGRLSAKSRDSGPALLADLAKINRLPDGALEPRKIDCMKQYLASLMGMQTTIKQLSNAKK